MRVLFLVLVVSACSPIYAGFHIRDLCDATSPAVTREMKAEHGCFGGQGND